MKLLIVDDHAVVREGVAAVLRQGADETTVLQAQDAATALEVLSAHSDIDVVLLDLMLPGVNGMDALDALGLRYPTVPIVVLSSSEAPGDVRRALAHGALGYIPKSASPATLSAALKLVLAGEIYVPPFVVRDEGVRGRHSGPAGLTERQVVVLALIGAGVANKEIAYRLGLSEKTVKAHLTAIFRTLNVSNRAQAAQVARETSMV